MNWVMNMKITFRIILTFLLWFTLISNQGCGEKPPVTLPQDLTSSLLWPSPPEKPRIQYLYSISKPEDIGASPSFFTKVVSVITGKESSHQIVRPYGIFYSENEVLYVADPGNRMVHRFDMKNHRYDQIKKYENRRVLMPIGLAMDHTGLLYVSDSILRRIFTFNHKGDGVIEIGKDNQLKRPTGIAIHPWLKRLYVVDTMDHSIKTFDLQGNYLFSFGKRGMGEGEFNFPTSLAIDSKGSLYVNDSLNYRIQAFDPDGRFLNLFGRHGDGMGEFSHPKGIALDTEGHIYVCDAIFDAIQIFDKNGRFLLSFGQAGQSPGEFWIPSWVFIDSRNRIFISDSYNQRIQVFKFLGGD